MRDAGDQADYGSAEFVALLDVLEHQEDDKGFLRSLVDKMQPGSTLLLTVPALQGLWSQWDEALGHFRRYDKASLHSVHRETCPSPCSRPAFSFRKWFPWE